MKYYKEEQIRTFRPAADLSSMVSVCLRKLFEDKEKRLNDEVVKGITFEELIGTLLKVEDKLKEESFIWKEN